MQVVCSPQKNTLKKYNKKENSPKWREKKDVDERYAI
jgi:hypothetical protein